GELKPGYMDLRYRLHTDLLDSEKVIVSSDEEFLEVFGRTWGGLLWLYSMENAEHGIVSMGSLASECTVAADALRSQGYRVGVVGVRAYRPFPARDLAAVLARVSGVTVMEKDVSYGYEGALAVDLKGALFDEGLHPKFNSHVAGLGGRDITSDEIVEVVKRDMDSGPVVSWINARL
ncbi:MAG: transketolase C-terminal domain-containing protein, partial [Desulfomonilaceae bacterium]